ncbi:hypothetical protein [Streptomyces sp. NBC_01233]|uniref:hypothetical protein n=1 Tax=Streptomyces sp. NBC_01233 TaxID=2903787 RepID=UPI002E1604F0|nr:hypothetical protein OG332_39620 [Streptomyces sp. NBC_01233]
MLTTITTIILTHAHTAQDWLPELAIALKLAAAGISFSVAVHRAARYWRKHR